MPGFGVRGGRHRLARAVARPRPPARRALPDSGHHQRLGAEGRRRRCARCACPTAPSFVPAAQLDPELSPDGAAASGRLGVGLGFGLVRGFACLPQRLVELVGIQPGIVERVAPTPVRQRQFRGHPDVLLARRVARHRATRRGPPRCGPPPGRRASRRRRRPRTAPRSGVTRCPAAPRRPTPARAAAMRRASSASSSAYRAAKASGSASKSSRRRITSTRTSTSREARTSTVSPNRSSSCGRSSPSSGFIVPISTNRASWQCEMPSRSMCTRPIAAASSSTSTRWSCSRLTSSTYSTPPCARGQQSRRERVLAVAQHLLQVQRPDHPVLGGADRQFDQPGLRVDRRPAPAPARAPPSTSRCPSRRGSARRRSRGAPRTAPAPAAAGPARRAR